MSISALPLAASVSPRRISDAHDGAPVILAEQTARVHADVATDPLALGARAAGRAFAATTLWTAVHLPDPKQYLTSPTARSSLALLGTGLCLLEGVRQVHVVPLLPEDSLVGEDEAALTYERMRLGTIAGACVLAGTYLGAHVGMMAGDYINAHVFGFV